MMPNWNKPKATITIATTSHTRARDMLCKYREMLMIITEITETSRNGREN